MGRAKKRRFGSMPVKTDRKSGTQYIEARYQPPVWAYSKWPGVLPKYICKSFPLGFELEAECWLNRAEAAIIRETWEPPKVKENEKRADRITFAEYATDYVEHRVRRNGDPIRETTKEKYRQYLRDHLLPVLGAKPMGGIMPEDVERWAASMEVGKAGEGAVVRRRVFELLRGIFNQACSRPLDASGQTLLKFNPVQIVIDRPDSKREYVDISLEELAAIHDAMPPRLALVIYLCGQIGLRPGEALALERQDFMLEADGHGGVVHVTKTVSEVDRDGHKVFVVTPPKTKGSVDDLPVPPWMVPVIQRHLDAFVDEDGSSKVFTGERTRDYVKQQTLRNAFYRARRAVPRIDALEPPLYNLRHRALTMDSAYTQNPRALMALGRHTQLSTAMRYQHVRKPEIEKVVAGWQAEAEEAGLAGKPTERPSKRVQASKSPSGGRTSKEDLTQLVEMLEAMNPSVRIAVLRKLDADKRRQVLLSCSPEMQAELMSQMLAAV